MRKILCFLAFFVLIAFVLYADEDEKSDVSRNEEIKNDVSQDEEKKSDTSQKKGVLNLGAGFSYSNNPKFYGGHLEFGIDLYRKKFFVQNKFLLRAGGFKAVELDNTALTLSEKLAFGRSDDDNLDMYIYLEGGAGFFGNAQNNFSRDTLIYNFGFGGGVELGDLDYGGFYVEAGYIYQKMTPTYPLSGVLFQAGWRIHL